MSISRRYVPEHPGGDRVLIGFDFAPLLAPGTAIMWPGSAADGTPTPRLEIYLNQPGNVNAVPGDFTVEPALAPVSPGGIWYWQLNPDNNVTAAWNVFALGTPLPANALALGTAVRGRAVYSLVHGGVPGLDYLFAFTVTDSLGNVWTRSAAMLAGATS